MPYSIEHAKTRLPKLVASAVAGGAPVKQSASQTDYVLPAGSSNARVLGVALASAASPGDPVAVQTEGIGVMRAGASLGVNTLVGVASPNGRVGPIAAGASGPADIKQIVGVSQQAAEEDDYFSVLIRPGTN